MYPRTLPGNHPAGNPDWQSQQLINVDTMYDAVEYSMGWLEFWLQRADNIGVTDTATECVLSLAVPAIKLSAMYMMAAVDQHQCCTHMLLQQAAAEAIASERVLAFGWNMVPFVSGPLRLTSLQCVLLVIRHWSSPVRGP